MHTDPTLTADETARVGHVITTEVERWLSATMRPVMDVTSDSVATLERVGLGQLGLAPHDATPAYVQAVRLIIDAAFATFEDMGRVRRLDGLGPTPMTSDTEGNRAMFRGLGWGVS